MNNKYIEKQEYKYIVIPETRMVVCECTTKIDWWNLKNSTYHNIPSDWDKNIDSVFKNNSYPEFTVRAIAKAHPNDVFNIETGKRIAKSKANIKVYYKIKTCLRKMVKSVEKLQKNLQEHYHDISYLTNKEFDHLDSLKH